MVYLTERISKIADTHTQLQISVYKEAVLVKLPYPNCSAGSPLNK